MGTCYVGVDIAGKNNTWITNLRSECKNGLFELTAEINKNKDSVEKIGSKIIEKKCKICCIDAPLSYDSTSEGGLRCSDNLLKDKLEEITKIKVYKNTKNIVMSSHSLQAVMVRGLFLLKALHMEVEVIESHPRASAYLLGLDSTTEDGNFHLDIYKDKKYKIKKNKGNESEETPSKILIENFKEIIIKEIDDIGKITIKGTDNTDGAFDSFVCAFTAFLHDKDFQKSHLKCENLRKETKTSESSIVDFAPKFIILESQQA